MKHFIKIIIGIIIIAGVYYALDSMRNQKESQIEPEIIRPVRTITLNGSKDSFRRRYFGTVQGGKRADLSFRVSGTLNKIYVEKGTNVKKGSLLASLDPRDFNTRISQASSALSQAQAQYKNAQADFTRYENLYKQRVIAKAQYDSYKTQLDVAKSAVNSANANLKSAKDALKDTELRAPFEGIIIDRKAENFQDITAKQTIFSLQDLNSLEIVFNIPDNDVLTAPIPNVKSIQDLKNHTDIFTMNARFEAVPDKVFPLALKEIAAQATSANTYPVTAVMPHQNDVRILPGMAVTVEVDLSGNTKKIENEKFSVPSTAILNQNNNNYVWRYENGKAHKIQVITGEIHNDSTIDIQNNSLNGGDVIITAGVYFLHDGQNVRLLESE